MRSDSFRDRRYSVAILSRKRQTTDRGHPVGSGNVAPSKVSGAPPLTNGRDNFRQLRALCTPRRKEALGGHQAKDADPYRVRNAPIGGSNKGPPDRALAQELVETG